MCGSLCWLFTVKVVKLCLYVERSEKCCLYSVENYEVGTRDQPMFLSVTVNNNVIVILYVCNVRCGVWVDVR